MARPPRDQIFALAKRGLAAGAIATGPISTEWDVAGRCQRPVMVEVYNYPDHVERKRTGNPHPYVVLMATKCRQCEVCLKQRAQEIARRARSELRVHPRTWFVTLTLQPEERLRVLSAARQRAFKAATPDFDALSARERFRMLCDVSSPLSTRWLKRVRKECSVLNEQNTPLRYLLVTEAHKDGFPHWHLLLHECDPVLPCRKRTLQDQWTHGFSQAKLCDGTDPKVAWYVCKYLAKSALTRVRVSLHYGELGLQP